MDFKNEYFSQWMTVWDFHKRWHGNNGSESEWDSIVSEAGTLMSKSDFSKDLALAVIGELERIDKKRRKDGVDHG